jgi:hypothetical protein
MNSNGNLRKVVRNGFEFWELPPAPKEMQLPPLPRSDANVERTAKALARMRDLTERSARARRWYAEKRAQIEAIGMAEVASRRTAKPQSQKAAPHAGWPAWGKYRDGGAA